MDRSALAPRAPRRRRSLGGSRATARAVWSVVMGLLALLAVLGLTDAGQVRAQTVPGNSLVESDPADGSTLSSPPEVMVFTFAERLGADDVLTAPVSCGSVPQRVGIPDIAADRQTVSVEVLSPFPRGACTISWSLRDGLNQPIAGGLITFSVASSPVNTPTSPGATTGTQQAGQEGAGTGAAGADSAGTDSAGTDSDGGVAGALWLGRVLSTTAILALFGAVALIGLAWPEGPEYTLTRRYLQTLWVVAMVGTVLFVVATVAATTDTSFGAALSPATWAELSAGSWSDRFALLRLFLVGLTVWSVWRPERLLDPATQVVAIAIPALAVVTVGLSRIGGSLPSLGIVLSISHAAASAVWFGGALLVTRVVASGPGEGDLIDAIRGFTRVSLPALVLTVLTGLGQLVRLDGGQLFTSGHGRVLLLKTLGVAAMVFMALATRQVVATRTRRARELGVGAAAQLRRAFGVEAAIGVVVLAMSGWLLGLTPPQDAPVVTYSVERQFLDRNSELDVRVLLVPSAVGLNGLRVEVRAPAVGVSDLRLLFVPPEGTEARIIEQVIPLTGLGAAVLDQSVGLPFDVEGEWTLQVSGITRAGTLSDATTTFIVQPAVPGD